MPVAVETPAKAPPKRRTRRPAKAAPPPNDLVLSPAAASAQEESIEASTEWAVRNCYREGVVVADAPGPLAWGILQELRDDSKFRSDVMKKLVTTSAAAKAARTASDDGRDVSDTLERFRQGCAGTA